MWRTEEEADLIKKIRAILSRVGRNPNTPIRKMDDGQYMIGDDGPLKIASLRSVSYRNDHAWTDLLDQHVMVWHGNNWQTLEEYLMGSKKQAWGEKVGFDMTYPLLTTVMKGGDAH